MALNPSGAISLAGPTAGQSIAVELGVSATATISLNDTNVRTLAQVPSGVIVMPTNFWGKSNITGTQKGIFGFGRISLPTSPFSGITNSYNLISSSGVVASNTPGVGTARETLAAATYGTDKAIFAYGRVIAPTPAALRLRNISNLVSNTGVVASDTPGVGTARFNLGAANYGGDKAIFAYGNTTPVGPVYLNMSNLVSNTGVVASDTPGVGTLRQNLAAAAYGGDKAIFGFGLAPSPVSYSSVINLVSNTGVVASNSPSVPGVTGRDSLGAANYGGDKAIFAFGAISITGTNVSNLVSNTGVLASDTPGVGTVKGQLSGTGYGGDKAIFGTGLVSGYVNTTNLVSNTGVVASDTPGVGPARNGYAAAGFSLTA